MIIALFLLTPTGVADAVEAGGSGKVRIAIFPLAVNGSGDTSYIERSVIDMLTSRIGSFGGIEVVDGLAVARELEGTVPPYSDDKAISSGRWLKADYVIFGSLSILGTDVSMDGRIADVAAREATPLVFMSKGKGLESIISLSDSLARAVGERVVGVLSIVGGVGGTGDLGTGKSEYSGKFAPVAAGDDETGGGSPAARLKGQDGAEGADESAAAGTFRSQTFDAFIRSIAIGDIDGSTGDEVVLVTAEKVMVGRFGSSGFDTIKEFTFTGSSENLHVDILDSDGDGRGEVYVSRLKSGEPDSVVIEHDGRGYSVTIKEIPYLIRALGSGDGRELIGQGYKKMKGFNGPVVKLKRVGPKSGQVLEPAGDLGIPSDLNLFGFEIIDIDGDGEVNLVAIDGVGRMAVYSPLKPVESGKKGGRQTLWSLHLTGEDTYGQSINNIETDKGSLVMNKNMRVKGRIIVAGGGGPSGSNALIVKRNFIEKRGARFLSQGQYYEDGELHILSWDGGGLKSTWKGAEVGAYLSDMALPTDNGKGDDKEKEIFIVVTGGIKLFTNKPKSYIISHQLAD